MVDIDILTTEEKADLLYCLKERKEGIVRKIQFFNEIIKGKTSYSFEILNDCLISCKKELDSIDLLMLKIQNLL